MLFAKSLGKLYKKQGNSFIVEVSQKDFGKTILRLKAKDIEHISAITGYDNGKSIELIYHFTYDEKILSIKTKIDRKKPMINSIVKQFPGAELYERECFEMFGVNFHGNPNLRGVLLSKESPKTPLMKNARKEYEKKG
ncbi:MAG: NADH-quinone oxidoreductase subunit C [Candidatus Aenigmatarchaeota archaeon]|nr:MAG: NADH-quinone oxidoreductase subunit C [Candidatus Aenigmarchaeota archaeon]